MSASTVEHGAVTVWEPSDSVEPLAEVLDRGGVLAVPTGSSYALAADPTNSSGVGLIYRIKQRPASEALPVVAADVARLEELGVSCRSLGGLEQAWPGPLTVVLTCRHAIPAAAGRATLAVRIPGDRRLRELLARLGRPLTATSANRSGEAPLVSPDSLQDLLAGYDAAIVDGGVCEGGAPSTLIRLEGRSVEVLRPGRMTVSHLRELAPHLEFREPAPRESRP